MFGLKRRKANTDDTQIPYQVYETVNEPNSRRRRLMIRLAVALLVVTLILAAILLWRRSQNDQTGNVPAEANQQFQQPPQTNPQLPQSSGDPTPTPLSDTTNDRTVDQPR